LAVQLAGVPAEFAAESAKFADQFGEGHHRDFHLATEVHRLGVVVGFRRHRDTFGRIADEEELPRGASGAPNVDVRLPLVAGFDRLL